MRSFMLRHKGAEFRLYGGEAVPAPLKGDRLKRRHPEARGFSRVRLHTEIAKIRKHAAIFMAALPNTGTTFCITGTIFSPSKSELPSNTGVSISSFMPSAKSPVSFAVICFAFPLSCSGFSGGARYAYPDAPENNSSADGSRYPRCDDELVKSVSFTCYKSLPLL